ncbi:MAG TPA: cupin domain-containing protein [Caulobacteraceae bacterium]
MKKIDLAQAEYLTGARYPAPHDQPCLTRERWRLGDVAGLTQFGVNLLRLPAGAWSSQRHWHTHEDEFVHVLQGEVVLVTDAGEEVLRAGDSAGFKAGVKDGHHLINRSDRDALVLEVGGRDDANDCGEYSDIDMIFTPAGFAHKDGTPY